MTISRRETAVVVLALVCLAPAQGIAQADSRFAGIMVDVGPLRAKGLGPYADRVGASLRTELNRAFADRLGSPSRTTAGERRGAPRLVVRVTAISLRDYAGGEGRAFGSGSAMNNDYLEGEALVLDPRGSVVAQVPQLSAVPASSGGAWYDPASESRRLDALTAHFAGWLARRVP